VGGRWTAAVAAVALILAVAIAVMPSAATAGGEVCGRPLSSEQTPLASDCLFILRTAVGQLTCNPVCVCDTNGSQSISASDALLCLRVAVGQPASLDCPCEATTTTTTTLPIPICGNARLESGESCDFLATPSGCGAGKQCGLVQGECSCEDIPGQIGSQVQFAPPPPADPDSLGLALFEDGTRLVFDAPETQLRIHPSLANPVTGVSRCARWISLCYSPPTRELDDCVRSAPACLTGQPWLEATACCPVACFTDYESRRMAGVAPMLAFDQTLFDDGSCMPGLVAFLGSN